LLLNLTAARDARRADDARTGGQVTEGASLAMGKMTVSGPTRMRGLTRCLGVEMLDASFSGRAKVHVPTTSWSLGPVGRRL
jgi:hypothetical protein